MNTAAVLAIIKYVQLAIAAAPDIEKAVVDAKNFITQLFQAKLITADQQNAIHSHIDAIALLFKAGQELPEHWRVEPDPAP